VRVQPPPCAQLHQLSVLWVLISPLVPLSLVVSYDAYYFLSVPLVVCVAVVRQLPCRVVGDDAKIESAALNNTSSSSESMSSVSSRDQFETVLPAKGRGKFGFRSPFLLLLRVAFCFRFSKCLVTKTGFFQFLEKLHEIKIFWCYYTSKSFLLYFMGMQAL
jgi:hypothetical protein